MKRLLVHGLTASAIAALGMAAPAWSQSAAVTVPVSAETAPSAQSGVNSAALVANPQDPSRSLIAGAGELGGIELYRLDGSRLGAVASGEAVGVGVEDGVALAGRSATLLAALDAQAARVRLFEIDPATGKTSEVGGAPIAIDFDGESLCLARGRRDDALYAFVLGGGGEIDQWLIYAAGDKLEGRLARRLRLASEVSYCAADNVSGDVYMAEQGVGVWRFDADPETEATPELIDARRLGHIADETGGVAVMDGGPGANYLIVSDASADAFNVYDREQDHHFVGAFKLGASATGVDAVQAAGGLFATRTPLGDAYPAGLLIAADDKNDAADNYKLASWAAIAEALHINPGAPRDPTAPAAPPLPVVTASVETRPVEHAGDAADDPAIWVDPSDPARSLIVATDKQAGLYVYDLKGEVVQFLPDGKMNNVDLRDGFRLGGREVTLVAASNRTDDSIALYALDPATRRLTSVADGVQATGLGDPYGLCMYRSRKTGKFHVFINDTDGRMRQWELAATKAGKVRAKVVRSWAFESQAEGCVVDDETGALYVAQEDVALWRMGAEPGAGDAKTAVAMVKDNPALKDDLEGVGLYDAGGGRGYLVVSSQGNNTYAVFRREGDNAYVGSFAVVADPASGIDGISETDGLDVTSKPLGAGFPKGAMVAQDGRNISPPERQNFKIVSWEAIAGRLGLE